MTVSYRRSDGTVAELGPDQVDRFVYGRTGREFRAVSVELPDPTTNQPVTRRRFGEVLSSGDVELLRVALNAAEYDPTAVDSRPHLYVLTYPGGTLVLKLSSIYVYEQLHANPSRFRNLLGFFAGDCARPRGIAEHARFADGEILAVIEAYGACHPELEIRIDRRRISGGLDLEHHVRLQYIDIRDADFSDRQFSGGVGYQVSTRFQNRMQRLGVLASVDLVYHSFRWREASDISQSMIRGNLSLGYSILKSERFRIQVTGGLSNYNAVSSSFRSFFSNNYFLLNGGLNVRTGNLLLGLHYEHLPGQIPRRPANQLLASVGYRIPL